MENIFRTVVVVLAMTLWSLSSIAGTESGIVTILHSRASDGLTYFELSGTPSNRPACAVNHPYWMILDENSERGKKLFALVLMAHATGKQVTVWGTNTCTRWHDGEDVDDIAVTD